ncbi:MAG: hypothetical protein K8T91_22590 [Planctomycetes bacterium]|nr:hypothetical protein [Planctomycetota bacterium]
MSELSAHPAVAELKTLWRPLLLACAALAWLATRHSPSTLAALVHYLALATIGCLLVFWVASLSQRRAMVLSVGLGSLALVILAYAWGDTYVRRWEDRGSTIYLDRQRRLGGAIVYRKVQRVADEGLGWSEGPMRDGQPHGRWERHETRPPKTEFMWYWMGQQVSEEKWKLRSAEG